MHAGQRGDHARQLLDSPGRLFDEALYLLAVVSVYDIPLLLELPQQIEMTQY